MHTVETARLILRPFVLDDLDALAAMNRDPQVMRFIGEGTPQSKEQTAARLNAIVEHSDRHGFGLWAAVEKTTGDLIGFCGLQFLDSTSEVEVGYRLAQRFWGMGLASEGANASLRYGFFGLKLDRIVAVVHPANFASQRVVEKIGLTHEKDARYYGVDVKYYAIAREAYEPDGSVYLCKSQEV
ncbi:MAG: GNAT family N-acetyltransferase [Acidobacteriota bacterium]